MTVIRSHIGANRLHYAWIIVGLTFVVVVVTAGRSQAAALGIDPQRQLADSPQAVVVSISDFGWTGPYADRAASELTLQAWAGSRRLKLSTWPARASPMQDSSRLFGPIDCVPLAFPPHQ